MVADLFFREGLAFETGRDDSIVSDDDVVLIGTDEVVVSENELVQQLVLVDGCFAICHEDLEDVSSD